jgi:hypothetical protein
VKLRELALCASIFSVLYGVCSPALAQAPGSVGRVTPQTADCNKVASKVSGLPPGFDPAGYTTCDDPQNARCKTDPAGGSGIPIIDGQDPIQDVIAACNIAPNFFQKSLSKLRAIYIDTDPNPSKPIAWGLRQRFITDWDDPDPNSRKKNIGISLRVWADPALRPRPGLPYASYETWVLNELLAPSSPSTWMASLVYSASPDPATSNPTISTPNAIAILGILAHEMGHILWWDKKVMNKQCAQGGRPFFYNFSWLNQPFIPRFHEFGEEFPQNRRRVGPDKDQVRLDIANQTFSQATNDLTQIYNGEWASLFATVAPDEDFVETYKLWVLTSPSAMQPLTSLSINIPTSGSVDVITLLNNPSTLHDKMGWMASCL